ncbi:hypothetical protein A2U01_0110026, partial [Trifolium medium]|nr:hypothetical protein [Trifolium medium]
RGAQECWRGAQERLQEADFGSGLCATRIPGWRNVRCGVQVWLWPLSFARRAGKACAARERDAYL